MFAVLAFLLQKNPSPTSGDSLSFNIKDCYGLISYYNVLLNSLMYLRKASRVSGCFKPYWMEVSR